jgi:hypothetical protein
MNSLQAPNTLGVGWMAFDARIILLVVTAWVPMHRRELYGDKLRAEPVVSEFKL